MSCPRHDPQRNAPVLPGIQTLKADRPCWGYRRIWARLPSEKDWSSTRRPSCALMREQGVVMQDPRLKDGGR